MVRPRPAPPCPSWSREDGAGPSARRTRDTQGRFAESFYSVPQPEPLEKPPNDQLLGSRARKGAPGKGHQLWWALPPRGPRHSLKTKTNMGDPGSLEGRLLRPRALGHRAPPPPRVCGLSGPQALPACGAPGEAAYLEDLVRTGDWKEREGR